MLAAANRGQSPCSVPADDDADDGAPAAASVSAPPHIMPAALCAARSLSLPLFWCMTIFGHLPPQPTNFPLLFVHFLG